ncbi:MAG: GTPase HflX, partial [Methylobacterium sp.]|nr:GTPase HflX [Methylobacterium sp.]
MGISIDAAEHALAADTRAFVIGPYLARHAVSRAAAGDENQRSHAARLDEAFGLAGAIDLQIVEAIPVVLTALRPATYLGKGKVEELAERVKIEEIGLVVMDCAL